MGFVVCFLVIVSNVLYFAVLHYLLVSLFLYSVTHGGNIIVGHYGGKRSNCIL